MAKSYTLADALSNAWETSRLKKFVDYQINPEASLQPNQRLLPGWSEGSQYTMQPGEMIDDAGTVYGQDGQPVEFVRPPMVRSFLDIFGNMLPGIAGGAPAGSVGSGIYRAVNDVGPSIKAEDAAAQADLALKMQAMHKRASQGYQMPDRYDTKGLAKADKALTTVSNTEPLSKYMDSAGRALELGYDTPAFHITNYKGEEDVLRKLAGTPFRVADPTFNGRGAMYFTNFENPSGALTSHAAQNAAGGKAYAFLLRDIMGENPMPPGLHNSLPDMLVYDKYGNMTSQSLGDMIAGMKSTPGYSDNMLATREATKQYLTETGQTFSDNKFAGLHDSREPEIAKFLMSQYYRPEPGGPSQVVHKVDPFAFQPIGINDPMPSFGEFESRAAKNLWQQPLSGLHSPMQNIIGSLGFSGARVADEMRKVGGKAYGMIGPTSIRAVGAKFKDGTSIDSLAGAAPPGWWLSLMDQQQQEQPK